jgi:hypothetical protein
MELNSNLKTQLQRANGTKMQLNCDLQGTNSSTTMVLSSRTSMPLQRWFYHQEQRIIYSKNTIVKNRII